jgi:uncharacterized membrane protein (UPF0127 family)
MTLTRWLPRRILDGLTQPRAGKPEVKLRISNVNRGVELACCVDVADHGATRRKGLLGRESLRDGEGLWITPCEAVHTFGMRFAIDLVYLDRKMRVKKVKSNVPPWRLSGCLSAHSVLELAAGTIRRTQTAAGDVLELSAAVPSTDAAIHSNSCKSDQVNPERSGLLQ